MNSVEKSKSSKTPWTAEEDAKLMSLISDPGTYGSWPRIAKQMNNRTGKQCRERYLNQLNPGIKKGSWTKEEDEIILKLHKEMGNKWCKYTDHLPGRSDNSIKNRWHVISRSDYVGNSVQAFTSAKNNINELLLKRATFAGDDQKQQLGIAANKHTAKTGRKKPHPLLPQSNGNGSTTDSSSSGENSPAPIHLRERMERISLDGRKKPPSKAGTTAGVAVDLNNVTRNGRDPLDDLCDMCNYSDVTISPGRGSSPHFFNMMSESRLVDTQIPLSSCSMDSYTFSVGSNHMSSNRSATHTASTQSSRHNGKPRGGFSICSSIDSEDEFGSSAQPRFVIPPYQQQQFQLNHMSSNQHQPNEIYNHPQHSASFTTVATANSTGTLGSASSGHSLFSNLSTGSFGICGSQQSSPVHQTQLDAIVETLSPNKFHDVAEILNDEDVLEFFDEGRVVSQPTNEKQNSYELEEFYNRTDNVPPASRVHKSSYVIEEEEIQKNDFVEDTYAVVTLNSDEAVDAVLDALINDMQQDNTKMNNEATAPADRNSAQIAAAAVELVEKMAASVHDPASNSENNLKKLLAYDSFTLKNGEADSTAHTSDDKCNYTEDVNTGSMNDASADAGSENTTTNASHLVQESSLAWPAPLPQGQPSNQAQPPRQSRKGKLASAVERPTLRPFSGSFGAANGTGLVERSPVAYTHLSPACPSTKRQCGFFCGSS